MKEYIINTPFDTQDELPNYFFNSDEYLSLQNQETIFNFKLVSEKSNKTLARIHFNFDKETAFNPSRAPFGGLEICISNFEILSSFLKRIEQILQSKGCQRIEIRNWPNAFQNIHSFSFEQNSYQLLYSDYNYHHEISAFSAIELFLKPEKKRFRKCQREGFIFEYWEKPDLNLAYDILFQFRSSKNIPLNISKEQLINSVSIFPEKYYFFTIKDENKIIGISVCVEVNESILYHFCLATDPEYYLFSPSVMLYEGIYRFCKTKNYKIFDFGTASISGQKQIGLSNFKVKLGGIETLKPTYFKVLS